MNLRDLDDELDTMSDTSIEDEEEDLEDAALVRNGATPGESLRSDFNRALELLETLRDILVEAFDDGAFDDLDADLLERLQGCQSDVDVFLEA